MLGALADSVPFVREWASIAADSLTNGTVCATGGAGPAPSRDLRDRRGGPASSRGLRDRWGELAWAPPRHETRPQRARAGSRVASPSVSLHSLCPLRRGNYRPIANPQNVRGEYNNSPRKKHPFLGYNSLVACTQETSRGMLNARMRLGASLSRSHMTW